MNRTEEAYRTDLGDRQIAAAEDRWKAGWQAGPTRLRWDKLPVQAGDPAPDAELADHECRALVRGPHGRIVHSHRYGWCEDYPDPRVHLAAIRIAAGVV